MEYRLLGRTGMPVSAYGLGTMTFGAETGEDESFAQLDAFIAAGGTLVDTADVYAGGASEKIVGRWLRERPSDVTDHVVLVTKGRFPSAATRGSEGTSRRHLRRALEGSLRRLGVDHVDVYLTHAWDPLTPLEETLCFLDDAVRAGHILYGGVSNYVGWQLQKACDLARVHNWTVPIALQPSYSLLVRDIEWEIVPAAIDNGLGILAWSPLGGGWLTGKYGREAPSGRTRLGEDPGRGLEAYDRRAQRDQTWQILDAVRAVATPRGVSLAQVALAWVAQKPGVSSVLLGARSGEHLTDNLRAARLRLTEEEMAALDAASAPHVGDYPYGADGVDQRTRRLPTSV